MKSSDHDIARRVLASVLDRLEGEKRTASAPSIVEQPDSPSNVFIIMLGNESGHGTGEQARAQSDISYVQPTIADSGNQKRSVEVHPSLQRFDLPLPDTCSPAPKMCFLEPDRVCVNSGACQSLGH